MNARLHFELLLIVALTFLKSSSCYQLLYRSIRPRDCPLITMREHESSTGPKSILFNHLSNRNDGFDTRKRLTLIKMQLNQNSNNQFRERMTLPDGHLYVPKGANLNRLICFSDMLIYMLIVDPDDDDHHDNNKNNVYPDSNCKTFKT